MYRFFPLEEETRLLDLDESQLQAKFKKHIKLVDRKSEDEDSDDFLFNGIWNDEEFSVSIKVRVSNNFIPIIHGKYMPADDGILLKLSYRLFPATKRLLAFWTILTILITLFFIGIHQAWLYGAISFGFCLVNYVLSIENFKSQLRKSKRRLEQMLS